MPEGELVYTPEAPWLPPADPVKFPEGRLTPKWVGGVTFGNPGAPPVDLVVRSHLNPMEPNDPRYMAAWRTFWRALSFANRKKVYLMLMRWKEAALEAQDRPDLSEEEATWIRRFLPNVDAALGRLQRAKAEPMSWAGAEFSKYQPEHRAMMEGLIGAIVLHRKGEISDAELYTILQAIDVDPDDFDDAIHTPNLNRVKKACVTGEPFTWETTYRNS